MKLILITLLTWQLVCQLPTINGRYYVLWRNAYYYFRQLASTNITGFEYEFGDGYLQNQLTLVEAYTMDTGARWQPEDFKDEDKFYNPPTICSSNQSSEYKREILQAIEKTLKFYESHLDTFSNDTNPAVGLLFLRDVDDKFGKRFQNSYPISQWTARICNKASSPAEVGVCEGLVRNWKNRQHSTKWHVIVRGNWSSIGDEKEFLGSILNGQCQAAIVSRCEIPYLCERTLYDPEPRSQYFLTHQMFQRILTEQSDCLSGKSLLNDDVNGQLCSKMYQEAKLIAQMGYPHIHRDLFGEYVSVCGYMRYPNFFREDWIQVLLSWQSKSEYGCFSNEKEYKSAFVTSDSPILRKSTPDELQRGVVSDEQCLPHYTSVSLSALAMSWDYMEENCP